MAEGRSLAETPTWSVATVTTVMVFVCLLVERSICRLGKWLKRTKRKAMLASLEKIREELVLLGLISLMLSQTARWISEICVPSSFLADDSLFAQRKILIRRGIRRNGVPIGRNSPATRLICSIIIALSITSPLFRLRGLSSFTASYSFLESLTSSTASQLLFCP
ncbi:MLO-like protein 4 [Platanthera zijinensis]|uniref:MLO-like protein 4 n=1 Tax=Platanthera zijinensis TaxID=2320716 RepID=A0AAP0BWR6_9ASPA